MTLDWRCDKAVWKALKTPYRVVKTAVQATLFRVEGSSLKTFSLCVVLGTDDDVRTLNRTFRGKDCPTNVLSFPSAIIGPQKRFLGDIILAGGVVAREAYDQKKSLHDHTTHLVVHGVLHLLGYDHVMEADAEKMETLEAEILSTLGLRNPYHDPLFVA